MRLPQITRIITEDLPSEVLEWIGKIVDPINNFMLTMKNGLNKGITVNDNMSGSVTSVAVTNNACTFQYDSARQPKVVLIGGWVCTSDATWVPTTGTSLKWAYSDGRIACTFYGFDTTKKYQISLMIIDD